MNLRLYAALIDIVSSAHAADRPYARWQLSQPMANWLSDQLDVPRGPVQGAWLLGVRCELANDPGGLRLNVTPPRRWPGSLDGLPMAEDQ